MKRVAIIPARYDSSRFQGKPLASILGKPMIQWVYENTASAKLLDAVYVATDDKRIYDRVTEFGGRVLMTSNKHTCGTERLGECVDILRLNDDDIVLNVQGDEPLINAQTIADIARIMEGEDVSMGTLAKRIVKQEEMSDPNVVKVVFDKNRNALYFSRFCLPYERDVKQTLHYRHIGIYGYKAAFLKLICEMPKTDLEIAESLEQLRVLENGYKIKVGLTAFQAIGVDIPEHIALIEEELLKQRKM